MLSLCLPLIGINIACFFLENSNGNISKTFGAAFNILFWLCLILVAIYMAVYAYNFLNIEIRHRNRLLRKILEDVTCVIPSIIICVIAYIDKSRTVALAVLLLYMMALYNDNQNELISLDPLTRLNNRNELTGYLWYKLSTPMRGRVCILMMDMNRFKQINDTYGHVEGDQALIAVASCLRKACGGAPGRPFIARYGGDEFIVVMETESDLDAEHLCDYIHMTLAVENHKLNKPYNLSISIGWVRNEQNNRSIKKLLRRADIELYEKKRQFKERERTA